MKIVKPDSMAVIHRAQRFQGRDYLAVGLVAFFGLDAPDLNALRGEAELWQTLPTLPGAPALLDEGYPKAAGEFIAYGAAFAPQAQAVPQLLVRIAIGDHAKNLIIHGDRHWGPLGGASTAKPFTQMPITPETAFGGPGHAANPRGKGVQPQPGPNGTVIHPLPNVEDVNHPLAFPGDQPAPAGFWGVDAGMPQRLSQLGPTDERWLSQTWPHLPDVTPADYFQSAPPDQRLPGFFTGTESIEITNMHADQPVLRGRLPGLRARCFANLKTADKPQFVEIGTRAETVWLFPNLSCAALLYRGVLPIQDEDGLDVLQLVADWEQLSAPPAPAELYQAQLSGSAAETSSAAASQASSLAAGAAGAASGMAAKSQTPATATTAATPAPATPTPTQADIEAQLLAQDPQLAEIHRMTAEMEAQTDRILAENGMTRAEITHLMRPPEPAPVSLDEIEKLTAEMQAQTDRILAENGLTRADIEHLMHPPEPAPVSLEEIHKMTADMEAQRLKMLADNGLTDADVAAFIRERSGNEELAALLEQPNPWLNASHPSLPTDAPKVDGTPKGRS